MAVDLFLFGSLRYPPLLKAVIGDLDHLTLTEAVLPGFRVRAVSEGPFPTIKAQSGAQAEGLHVAGLTSGDHSAIAFYEAAFEYHLRPVTLADGQVTQAYFPPDGVWQPAGDWSLDEWIRKWGAMSVHAAREVMAYRDTKTPAEVSEMLPMIRARAWSRISASQSKHGALTLKGQVDITDRRRPYARYFAVEELHLRHEKFNGGQSCELMRAVFCVPDAALVLPYDPQRDRVLLVEQIRMGPITRGDQALWQLEPIAGRIDPGEQPQEAARREAQEEAGLTLGALHSVAETYCSPGNSSEFYYIYVGLADLPETACGVGGLAVENEDIRSHLLSFEDLMQMCATLQIGNAPLVMAAYWLAHHRDRLRSSA